MKRTVISALAVCAASSLAFANESEDWLTLDQEIESLAGSLSQGGGVAVSAFIKTTYNTSSDVMSGPAVGAPPTPNDWGGFAVNNIRLNFDGSVGDFGVHIGLELGPDFGGFTAFGGGANAPIPGTPLGFPPGIYGGGSDAYATFNITEQISGQAGIFRAPFQGDSLRDEDELLFIDRTFNGDFWANIVGRDAGIQFSGMYDQLGWWIAVLNGRDGQGDELAFAGRVSFNAMGNGTGSAEGAYGADDASNLTLALGYYMDDDSTLAAGLDADAMAFDADYTMGALYASISVVDMSDGFGALTEALVDPAAATVGTTGDQTAWDLTVSYMLAEDSWEAGLRYEDLDDNDDTTVLSAVVNKYVEGHDAKWQIQYSTVESDVSTTEVDVISLGLTVSV